MSGTIFLFALSALTADLPPPPAFDARSSVQFETYSALQTRLRRAIADRNYEDVLSAAKAMSAHPDFQQLDERQRALVHYLIGAANLELDRPEAALPSLMIATESEGSIADMWFSRLNAQSALRDRNASARTVRLMLERFPAEVNRFNDTYLSQLAGSRELDGDVAFDLRLALFQSQWSYEHTSWLWLQLIDDLIARRREAEAPAVFERVTAPGARLQLFAMHRYDAVRPAGAVADLNILFDRDLEADRKAAEAPEATLKERGAYAGSLLVRGRFEDVLAVTDRALTGPEPEAGTDEADDFTWVMDTRARALMELGRPDEALELMRAAAARKEGEGVNVSQSINLGWFYLRLGRNADALAAVAAVPDDGISPYGRMQATQVRACAADALGDTATADKAHAWLAEHWRDAPVAAYEARACRGDEDGMAAALIRMFEDPEYDASAVEMMHAHLPPSRPTAFDQRMGAMADRVLSRPDVVAARDRVGRALEVPTVGQQF